MGALRSDDGAARVTALTKLCELLAVTSEDGMVGMPVEAMVPALVESVEGRGLADDAWAADAPLLAARALTFLADALPAATSAIVRANGVAALVRRLAVPEFIDLAEQCLACLQKIAAVHPRSALAGGGLAATLAHIDFFQTGVQRTAAATAASMVRGLTPETAGDAVSGVPLLATLLHSPDARVVEAGCTALARVADVAAASPDLAAALDGASVASTAASKLALGDGGAPTAGVGGATYFALLRLLTATATARPEAAAAALEAGAASTVGALVASSPLLLSRVAPPAAAAVVCTVDQLATALDAAVALLPPLLDAGDVVTAGEAARAPARGDGAAARAAWLAAHPAIGDAVTDMLPPLIAAYDAAAGFAARAACVDAIARGLAASPPAALARAPRRRAPLLPHLLPPARPGRPHRGVRRAPGRVAG